MTDPFHVSIKVWHNCFLFFVKSWNESYFECVGALVWNNF
jgi:hypothetical protein